MGFDWQLSVHLLQLRLLIRIPPHPETVCLPILETGRGLESRALNVAALPRQSTLQVALVPDETSYASAPSTAVQIEGRVRAKQSCAGHPQ